MIQLVTHEYCNGCPLFEAKSISQVDYSVEGCMRHFVSCVHHTVCANTESRIREAIKEEKENSNG